MKKTIQINLSGSIFHIDEDAYEWFNTYLERIHRHFRHQEGGKEIIGDIERRMAELFQDKLTGAKQVISLADVQEVVERMGEPEDFGERESPSEGGASGGRGKKLYRDPDQAILGGVAGGIGTYLNIDPVWIRLVFVLLLLAYGFVGILYLLLWIFVPRAETYEQKLEMRGENPTISNIEEKVRREYEGMKTNFSKYRHSQAYRNFTKALNEIFMLLGRILKVAFQVVLIVIGAGLIIAGIGIIMGMLGISFIPWSVPFFDGLTSGEPALMVILRSIFHPTGFALTLTGLILLMGLPVLIIVYIGVRLLIGFGPGDRTLLISSLVIWFVALFLTAGSILNQVRHFSTRAYTLSEHAFEPAATGNLNLQIGHSPEKIYFFDNIPFFGEDHYPTGTNPTGDLFIQPRISILESPDESYRLTIKQSARGPSHQKAAQMAEKINYSWSIKDSTLLMAPYMKIPHPLPYRLQNTTLKIYVPEGRRITIPENAEKYIKEADTHREMWPHEMGNKIWEMRNRQLHLVRELN